MRCLFFCIVFLTCVAFRLNAYSWQPTDSLPPAPTPQVFVHILVHDYDRAALLKIFPKLPLAAYSDTLRAIPPFAPDQFLAELRSAAYLSAALDPVLPQDTTLYQLHLGPMMRWVSLRMADEATRRWSEDVGFLPRDYQGKALRAERILQLERRMLEQAEDNGYPFAVIWLDSVLIGADGGVSACLHAVRGPYISIKALKITGDVRLPARLLPRYLGLEAGMPYSRSRLLRIKDELRLLPYLESAANPSVSFSEGEATIKLWLKKKRASRFDFIIGLLPQQTNNNDPNVSNRLIVTGSLNAAFQNALSLGERFAIEFERLRPETQKLDLQTSVPYLFGSPFGAEARLNIFRRDSTWVDAAAQVGVQYLLPGGNSLAIFWENKSSFLQKIDTLRLLQTRRLPPNLDFRQNGLGLESVLNHLDDRFNPRRGWLLQATAFAGFHQIRRNPDVEALKDPNNETFSFSSLYDTTTLRSIRYRVEARAEAFVPLFQRTTLLLRVRGGGLFTEKNVYQNEQYRLGGTKLLRGFDEESLFATRWALGTAELRLLLGLRSYMAVFTDYAYIENHTYNTRVFLRPRSVGVGMNFETPAGIFGISIASGQRSREEGLDLRSAKFHLGYVSLF